MHVGFFAIDAKQLCSLMLHGSTYIFGWYTPVLLKIYMYLKLCAWHICWPCWLSYWWTCTVCWPSRLHSSETAAGLQPLLMVATATRASPDCLSPQSKFYSSLLLFAYLAAAGSCHHCLWLLLPHKHCLIVFHPNQNLSISPFVCVSSGKQHKHQVPVVRTEQPRFSKAVAGGVEEIFSRVAKEGEN